ncbi:DUF4123 domain-containing protein [Pseudomonas floridensis]|uniref:DUF4123 domain-containing protein n=1 Tax=Pseudomonas floridensis TaxID=1958950 RepID=UPI0039E9F8CE
MLLERTERLLEKLYQLLPAPKHNVLFDRTELAPCRDKSPLWLTIDDNSALLDAIHANPEIWPGLIMQSSWSADCVFDHLRHILIIIFDARRRGVLRYWDPITASYFFTSSGIDESPLWLGPIANLSWYGGTWADHAHGTLRWFQIANPHACNRARPAHAFTPILNVAHEDALRLQERERFVYGWWKKHTDTPFPHALAYLDEGMAHGFETDPALMNRYLSIRARHPDHQSPPRQHGDTGEERLNALQHVLQQPRHSTEFTR